MSDNPDEGADYTRGRSKGAAATSRAGTIATDGCHRVGFPHHALSESAMTGTAGKPGASKALWVIIAALYAIPVALVVWLNFPTEQQIKSQTAASALWALQQHDDKYKKMATKDLRRRLYRGLSDDQVTARVREFAMTEEREMKSRVNKFAVTEETRMSTLSQELADEGVRPLGESPEVAFRPTVSLRMDDIDKNHAQQMASLESEQMKMIALGVTAWALPLVVLYFLSSGISRTWKQKRIRRI